jgi:DNA-binding NarL/FixJ family response regulator
MKEAKITVMLADDTEVARVGWRGMLGTADDIVVVGEAENPLQALRLAREAKPDVVLMDLKWAGDTTAGWTAISQLKNAHPEMRVIAITAYESLIPDARRAGADQAILKTFRGQELIDLIRELASSREAFPPAAPRESPLDELSPREREVLALLVDGLADKEIAEALSIAPNTARNHVRNVLSKLGVNNRTKAVALAHEHGFGG